MKTVHRVEASTPEELRREFIDYLEDRRTKLADEFHLRKKPTRLYIHGHYRAKQMLDEVIQFITDLEIEERKMNKSVVARIGAPPLV